MIKHFDHQHETVAQVRDCSGVAPVTEDWAWAAELAEHEANVANVAPGGIVSPNPRKPFSMGYAYAEALRNEAGTGILFVDPAITPESVEKEQGLAARKAAPTVNPSGGSPKQIDLIRSLQEERGLAVDSVEHLRSLHWKDIKALINKLFATPRAAKPKAAPATVTATAPATVTEDGIYRDPDTGEIFKVQWNRGSGDGRSLYAKRLVGEKWTDNGKEVFNGPSLTGDTDESIDWTFEYAPGALRKISPEWRLTKEEAQAFGKLYGRCVRCARTLTHEDSIARMMGSTCYGKMGF